MQEDRAPLAAGPAVRSVLRGLLEAIRRNERGTIDDLDAEFLHDLRVAVRRTRVAIGRMRSVLSADAVRRFGPEFKWLGKATSAARDLDVLSARLARRLSIWDDAARHELAQVVRQLEVERRRAHDALARILGSERYRRLIDGWSAFVELEPDGGSAPAAAGEPVDALAATWIAAARERVLDRGGTMTSESPMGDLHRLRIDAKKLRYLLEFFRERFRVESQIRALKRLQDNLGDLHDAHVQRQLLDQLASAGTTAVVARLVAELDAVDEIERSRFEEHFAEFASSR